jgi:hypothetical protein
MEYLIGAVLAPTVLGLTTLAGIGRGRNFYPLILIVVAHYYLLFAAMAASAQALLLEAAAAGVFMSLAALGFRTSSWLVAAALAGHGLFDTTHHLFIDNPGVPDWWPGFCMTFDVVAGGILAVLLIKQPHSATFEAAAGVRKRGSLTLFQ